MEWQTWLGILLRLGSMLTTDIIVTVMRTVETQPMRLSQDSLLKLGTKIMGTMQGRLTATAKWRGDRPLTPAKHYIHQEAFSNGIMLQIPKLATSRLNFTFYIPGCLAVLTSVREHALEVGAH